MSLDIPLINGNGTPIMSNYENMEEYNNFIAPPSSRPNLVIALQPEYGTKPWSPRSESKAPQNLFIERDNQHKGFSIMDLTTPTHKSHKLERIEELIESDYRYSSDNQQQIQSGIPEETDGRLEGGFGCYPKGRKKKSKKKKIKECCERCKQEINKDIPDKKSRGPLTRNKSKEDCQCQNENVCNCKKKDMDDRQAKKLPCKCKHDDLSADNKPKKRERRQSDDVCPCKKEDMDDISVESISTSSSCYSSKSGHKLKIIESLEKRIRTIIDELHNIREEIIPSNELQILSKYFNELSTLLMHRRIQLQSSVDKTKGVQQIFRQNTSQQTDNLEYVKVSQNTETTFIRKTNPGIESLEKKSQVSRSQHCNASLKDLKHLPCIKEEISDIEVPQTPPELNCKRCLEVRICESCQKEFIPANINHMTEKVRRGKDESSNMIPMNSNCQKTYKNSAMIPHFHKCLDDLNQLHPCMQEEISNIIVSETPPELNCKKCYEIRICESCQKAIIPAKLNRITEKVCRNAEESSKMLPANNNYQKTYKNIAQRRSTIPQFNESLDDLNHLHPPMQEDISDIEFSETPPELNCKKCYEVRVCESCKKKEIIPAKMNRMTEKVCRDTEESSKMLPANNNYQKTYENLAQRRSTIPQFNESLDDLNHLHPPMQENISDIGFSETPPELNCKKCYEVRICESCKKKEIIPAKMNRMTEKVCRDTEESSKMLPANNNYQKTYENIAQRRSTIPQFNESLDDLNHLHPPMQENISDIGFSETPPELNCKKCYEVRICESCKKEIIPAKLNRKTEKVCSDTEESSKMLPENNNYQKTYNNTAQRSMIPHFNESLDDFSHVHPPMQEEISDIGISETPPEANCIRCYEGRIYESCPKSVIPAKMNRMTEKDCIDTVESSNMLPANNKYQKTYKNAGKWRSVIPQPQPQVQSPTCNCSDKNVHCKACKNSANTSHTCADGGHEFNNQNKSKTPSKQYGPKISNRDSSKNNKLYYRKSHLKSYNNNRMSFCNDYTCNWKSSRFQHAYPSSMSPSFSRSCDCEPEKPKSSRRFEHSNHLDVSNGSRPMSVNIADMPVDSSNSISTKSSNESVISHHLFEVVAELIKDFDPENVAFTVISRPNNIYRINISISNTGKSVADIYATQSALRQAQRQNLFYKHTVFNVSDSKFPQDAFLGHSFQLINTETCQTVNFKSSKNSPHKKKHSDNSKRTPKSEPGNYSTSNANRLKGGNSSTQLREEDDFRPSKGPFSPKGRYIDMSNNPYGQKQKEKSVRIRKLEHQIHNLLEELQYITEDLVPQADVNRFSNLSNRLEELNELLGYFRSNYHKINNPNISTEQAKLNNENEYSLEAIKIEDRESSYLKNTLNNTETRPSIQKRETIKTIKDPLPTERFLSSNNYSNAFINKTVRTSSNQCEAPVKPEDNYAPPTSSECKQFLESIKHPRNLFERHLLMMNDFRADAELRRQRLERKRREKAYLKEKRNTQEHHQEPMQEINEKREDDENTPTMRYNPYRDADENTPILKYSPYRNMGGASASYGQYKIETKSTQTDFISSNMSDSDEKDNPKRNTQVLLSETDSTSETDIETTHYNSPDIYNLSSKYNVIESNLGKTLVDVLHKHNTAPCTAVLTITLEENNLYQINIWTSASGKSLEILFATDAAIHEAESQKMFSKFLTYILVTQNNTIEQKHKLLDQSYKIINQNQ